MRPRKRRPSSWCRFKADMRTRMLSGLLVIVPLGITAFVINFLYSFTAAYTADFVAEFLGEMPRYVQAAASVLVFVVVLYVVGLIATIFVGREIIALVEAIIRRIPLIKTIYGASKQFVEALSFEDSDENFKAAVMVDFPRPGMKALAFVTGTITIAGEGELYKIFIPTTPNPTSGYFEIIAKDAVAKSGLSVEEAITYIMSGGVVAANEIIVQAPPEPRGKVRPL